jgi:hypothetical protein
MKSDDVEPSGKNADGPEETTTAQRRARRNMAELAQGWDGLEDWEMEEWWKRARHIRIRIRRRKDPQAHLKPRTRAMRGEELYVRINRVLELCGYKRCRVPPPPPKPFSNPVKPELKATLGGGRFKLKLLVRKAPVSDIMVYASPPRRAGQGPGGHYAFLGLSPTPRNGEVDITDMFLAKLREWLRLRSPLYHVPLAGSRICIRTWPQDNGWEGKGWMMTSQGRVPRMG